MNLKPQIITVKKFHLVGMKTSLTFYNNSPVALWQQFMPRKKEIQNIYKDELFSVQTYPTSYFESFNPESAFTILASTRVKFESLKVPDGMEHFIIQEGLYAKFTLTGMNIQALMNSIITEWLPKSGFQIANRPHFQLMDKRYKHNQDDSEEDVYIPITPNSTL